MIADLFDTIEDGESCISLYTNAVCEGILPPSPGKPFSSLQHAPYLKDRFGYNRLALMIFNEINSGCDFFFYTDLKMIFDRRTIAEYFSTPDETIPNMFVKGERAHKIYRAQRVIDFCLERKDLVKLSIDIAPRVLTKLLIAGVRSHE